MKVTNILILVMLAVVVTSCSIRGTTVSVASTTGLEFTDAAFQNARAEIDRRPGASLGYVNLAALYMKQARKTGDFFLNEKAEEYVAEALRLEPTSVPARKLEASLHLANHRFAEAVEAATKLRDEIPSDSFVYGVLADAQMETGDYANAIASAQKMVDLKPGTASYSRVAQIRSLHGDHEGAVDMFLQAARAADPNDKETQSWCLVQLGDEYWKVGKYADAERLYDEALANYPNYFLATVSKGRVRASLGDFASAERLLADVQAVLPNANAAHLLGDIYATRGDQEKADRQYAHFDQMQERLGAAADHKKLITSMADRGRAEAALELARKEYEAEKSIHSADLMAWALYKVGKAGEAREYAREALRLGTRDARLLYHAGMIAKANGDRREATRLLSQALKLNPGFDLVQSGEARRALAELQ